MTPRKNETREEYTARKSAYEQKRYINSKERSAINRASQLRIQAAKRATAQNPLSPAHKQELRRLITLALEERGPMTAREIRNRLPEAYRPGVVAMLRVMTNDRVVVPETVTVTGNRAQLNSYRLARKVDPANPWLGLLTH